MAGSARFLGHVLGPQVLLGNALRSLCCELVAVDDLKRAFAANPSMREATFTAAEIATCEGKRYPLVHYAARWAAKRACLSVLDAAEGHWLEVETVNAVGGRPAIQLRGQAREAADRAGVRQALVSLTHTRAHAAAFVVLEC